MRLPLIILSVPETLRILFRESAVLILPDPIICMLAILIQLHIDLILSDGLFNHLSLISIMALEQEIWSVMKFKKQLIMTAPLILNVDNRNQLQDCDGTVCHQIQGLLLNIHFDKVLISMTPAPIF